MHVFHQKSKKKSEKIQDALHYLPMQARKTLGKQIRYLWIIEGTILNFVTAYILNYEWHKVHTELQYQKTSVCYFK